MVRRISAKSYGQSILIPRSFSWDFFSATREVLPIGAIASPSRAFAGPAPLLVAKGFPCFLSFYLASQWLNQFTFVGIAQHGLLTASSETLRHPLAIKVALVALVALLETEEGKPPVRGGKSLIFYVQISTSSVSVLAAIGNWGPYGFFDGGFVASKRSAMASVATCCGTEEL